MTSWTRALRLRRLVGLALVLFPLPAVAQVSPTAPVHPTMPWAGITTPYGQFIRFVYMPPQPVTLEYLIAAPEPPPAGVDAGPPTGEAAAGGAAREEPRAPEEPAREPAPPMPSIVRQQVTIPGYYVRETTVGFHYPERWAIEQTGLNAYRWRRLPPHFVPK